MSDHGVPKELYEALFAHFSHEQIVDLTRIIAKINAWSRLAIGFGHGPDAKR